MYPVPLFPASAPTPPPGRPAVRRLPPLPPSVEAALWHGDEFGSATTAVLPSGWETLDRELPGGGWPCQAVTEILNPQPSVVEWRLLGPVLRHVVGTGGQVVVVGPPKRPHLPGLAHAGIDDRQLVWIQAETPAERLWVTEQLVKSNACGALVSWLPQARAAQLRRLQVCAQGCTGPTFLFRPDSARFEASPAPLRVQATFHVDWRLVVHLLKRRGPVHEGVLELPSIPGGPDAVLTPRLRTPSQLISRRVAPDVVGSAASTPGVRQSAAIS